MDKTTKAVHVFDSCAEGYAEKFMDISAYHVSLDRFCAALTQPGAHILELACGPGNITRYLLQQRPDLRVLATDLAPKMLELAQKNNPTAAVQLLDCRDTWRLAEKFDGIVCGFGLPYLSKPEAIQLIRDAALALNPGGVLYLSTMEDDYAKSGEKTSSSGEHTLFLHYHEAGYLAEALSASGFEVVFLDRSDYPEADGSVTKDLLIVAALRMNQ